jgi:hypothetical protein
MCSGDQSSPKRSLLSTSSSSASAASAPASSAPSSLLPATGGAGAGAGAAGASLSCLLPALPVPLTASTLLNSRLYLTHHSGAGVVRVSSVIGFSPASADHTPGSGAAAGAGVGLGVGGGSGAVGAGGGAGGSGLLADAVGAGADASDVKDGGGGAAGGAGLSAGLIRPFVPNSDRGTACTLSPFPFLRFSRPRLWLTAVCCLLHVCDVMSVVRWWCR